MSRGLWVKVSVDLPRHAKLYRLARRLNITRRDAFYYVFNLWRFAMLNYPDGNLPADDEELAYGCDLDESIDPAQFAYELVHCGESRPGFLDELKNGYHVHDWEQYSGEKADRREYYKEYRRRKREQAHDTNSSRTVREQCAQQCESLHVHPLEPDPEPEPEKSKSIVSRVVDTDIQESIPEFGIPTKKPKKVSRMTKKDTEGYKNEFEELWEGYPRHKNSGKQKAFEGYCKRRRDGVSFEDFKKAVEGYSRYITESCKSPEYIMMGSTFFGPSGRWKDFIGSDDEPRLAFGGMMEPENNQHFENENDLIQKEFGGDVNAYAKWIAAGCP